MRRYTAHARRHSTLILIVASRAGDVQLVSQPFPGKLNDIIGHGINNWYPSLHVDIAIAPWTAA
jgi:hypothetical protein